MWFWWIMLFPTIIVHIPFYGKSDGVIGWSGLVICVVECVIMLVSIFPTEKALKNTFNEDGTSISCKQSFILRWCGIMIYSLVGYWKYITVRWKMYGEDNFY